MCGDMFASMLGIEFDTTPVAPISRWEESVKASIGISGDWSAKISIILTNSLATRIACAMFGMEEDEITSEEIFDAVGELVNVIGGNTKGIVNGDCSLTLPEVSTFDGQKSEPTISLTYLNDGQPMNVQLFDMN